MKSTPKKCLVLLLALTLLLTIFIGCGTEASDQSQSASTVSEVSLSASSEAAPERSNVEEVSGEDSTQASEEPEAQLVSYALPLTDTPEDYQWFIMNNALLGRVAEHDDWNDNDTIRNLSEITGANIQMVGVTDGSTQLNLLLASGDYPEVMSGFGVYYPGGYDAAIEEELILDLNDYLDIMPNYQYHLNAHPDLTTKIHTDTGKLWGCARFSVDEAGANGFVIRQDWLEQLSLEVPETLSELETVLTTFASEIPTAANGPLLMYNTGCFSGFGLSYAFNNSFNIGIVGAMEGSPFINQDGTVVFTPATENWKKYLEVVQDWYRKGLIYQDFSAVGLMQMESTFLEGKVGVLEAGYLTMGSLQDDAGNSVCVGMKFPLNDINGDSEPIHVGPKTNIVDTQYSVSISAMTENVELLLTFMDYLYSEEGRIAASYGIEGTTYERNAQGTPEFTEYVMNNPDGYTVDEVRVAYCFKQAPIWWDWTLEESMSNYTDVQYEARRLWDTYDDAYVLPPITLTTEESSEVSSTLSDLITYISEFDLRIITTDADLDAEWDGFIERLETTGYEKVTAAYQSALDRYLNR